MEGSLSTFNDPELGMRSWTGEWLLEIQSLFFILSVSEECANGESRACAQVLHGRTLFCRVM